MSVNRRLVLSTLVGGCATVIPAGVGWTAPDPEPAKSFRRMALPTDIEASYPRGQVFGSHWISTGKVLVDVDSPEGEAIAREQAVNLCPDGTIEHREPCR